MARVPVWQVHTRLVEQDVQITQPPTDQGCERGMGPRNRFDNDLLIGTFPA